MERKCVECQRKAKTVRRANGKDIHICSGNCYMDYLIKCAEQMNIKTDWTDSDYQRWRIPRIENCGPNCKKCKDKMKRIE